MKRVIYFVLPLTLLLSMVVLACSEATINQKTTTDKTVFEPTTTTNTKEVATTTTTTTIPTYTITFDKNDGGANGTMANQTIASGSFSKLSFNTFTKSWLCFCWVGYNS